jgi:hypothetical protein
LIIDLSLQGILYIPFDTLLVILWLYFCNLMVPWSLEWNIKCCVLIDPPYLIQSPKLISKFKSSLIFDFMVTSSSLNTIVIFLWTNRTCFFFRGLWPMVYFCFGLFFKWTCFSNSYSDFHPLMLQGPIYFIRKKEVQIAVKMG